MKCFHHNINDICNANYANETIMSMSDFFRQQCEEWLKNNKNNLQNNTKTITQKSRATFTYGDCVPKQGWKNYEEYMLPCVPPDEYLTHETYPLPSYMQPIVPLVNIIK